MNFPTKEKVELPKGILTLTNFLFFCALFDHRHKTSKKSADSVSFLSFRFPVNSQLSQANNLLFLSSKKIELTLSSWSSVCLLISSVFSNCHWVQIENK